MTRQTYDCLWGKGSRFSPSETDIKGGSSGLVTLKGGGGLADVAAKGAIATAYETQRMQSHGGCKTIRSLKAIVT
jgi:hypothetical protein